MAKYNMDRINHKLTNADGTELVVSTIKELNRLGGINDMNAIEILVIAKSSDTYQEIQNFLAGDLSTMTYDYDIVYENDSDTLYHRTYTFEGYTNNIDISYGRGPIQFNTCPTYYITIRQVNEAYKKAVATQQDILTMYEAIADQYESAN